GGSAGALPAVPTGPDPLYRTTFVGRGGGLRQLRAGVGGALGGRGARLLVGGGPGIGKTARCEQLAAYVARRGGRTLRGQCYEEGALSLPYLPFVEALRAYAHDRDPTALRQELGTGAPYVARIVSEVRERLGVALPAAGDAEDDRWRLLEAVSGLLHRAAATQPLLLILEDLHWADRGTLDLLLHLARNLAGACLLVAAT